MEVSKRKAFECKDCGVVSSCKTDFDTHLQTHIGDRPYRCSICGKSFSRDYNCTKHELTHLGEKPFKCDICTLKYATKQSLSKHMRFHTGVNLLSCTVCSRKFTQSSHLNRHLRTHTGEKPFKCSSCNKSFAVEYNLRMHETVHEKKEITCSICETKFSHQGSYWRHMRKHGTKKGFENHIYDKEFSSNSNLDSNSESPVRKGPFKCQVCDREFRVQSDLKEHSLIHEEVVETLQCFECGEQFVCKIRFRDHMQQHSGSLHYCVECNKKFANGYSLENHRKIHAVETINCFHCQKTFSSWSDVKKHRLGRECLLNKFRCSLCDKVFLRKGNVVQHMKKFHSCEGESNEISSSNVENIIHCSVCEKFFRNERSCIWHEVCVHKFVEQLESNDSVQIWGLMDTSVVIADRASESDINVEGNTSDIVVKVPCSNSGDNDAKHLFLENEKDSWNFVQENSIFIKKEHVDKDNFDLSYHKKVVDPLEVDCFSEVKVNIENHIIIKEDNFNGSREQEPSNSVSQLESVSTEDLYADSACGNKAIWRGNTGNDIELLDAKYDGICPENLCLENTIYVKEEVMDFDTPEVT